MPRVAGGQANSSDPPLAAQASVAPTKGPLHATSRVESPTAAAPRDEHSVMPPGSGSAVAAAEDTSEGGDDGSSSTPWWFVVVIVAPSVGCAAAAAAARWKRRHRVPLHQFLTEMEKARGKFVHNENEMQPKEDPCAVSRSCQQYHDMDEVAVAPSQRVPSQSEQPDQSTFSTDAKWARDVQQSCLRVEDPALSPVFSNRALTDRTPSFRTSNRSSDRLERLGGWDRCEVAPRLQSVPSLMSPTRAPTTSDIATRSAQRLRRGSPRVLRVREHGSA